MVRKKVNQCPDCGGNFKFNVETLSLKCANCGRIKTVPKVPAQELNYVDAEIKENANEWGSHVHSYKCESCGAVQIQNDGDLSDVCQFCGSPNIVDHENCGLLVPNAVLPFSISSENAKNIILNKIKSNKWAPNSLAKNFMLDRVKGVYTPTFTFDFLVSGTYNGRLGREVERKISLRDGTFSTVRETKWFNVSGNISKNINDVLVDAGQIIKGATLQGLEPFNTNIALKYDKSFLSGFIANETSKKISVAKKQAEQMVLIDIKEEIRKQNFADKVEFIDFNLNFSDEKYKYILLPVYVSNFKFKQKNNPVFINGTTGKFFGKIPKSGWKIAGLVFGIFGLIALVLILINFFA